MKTEGVAVLVEAIRGLTFTVAMVGLSVTISLITISFNLMAKKRKED